ncbi:uncharacterized protein NEMAJ01_0672 [Nematocida major]|uniref:uncharacterized protein n=1 Tax=Nematocida major TaxID=1912982 RepID=UPI0020073442|nr:uncharacterized protein NEMAJ01_0672 [Nematocida major]KAH9385776.1 hypothetical protein NEMAJ01_0672 [Nematocida major]
MSFWNKNAALSKMWLCAGICRNLRGCARAKAAGRIFAIAALPLVLGGAAAAGESGYLPRRELRETMEKWCKEYEGGGVSWQACREMLQCARKCSILDELQLPAANSLSECAEAIIYMRIEAQKKGEFASRAESTILSRILCRRKAPCISLSVFNLHEASHFQSIIDGLGAQHRMLCEKDMQQADALKEFLETAVCMQEAVCTMGQRLHTAILYMNLTIEGFNEMANLEAVLWKDQQSGPVLQSMSTLMGLQLFRGDHPDKAASMIIQIEKAFSDISNVYSRFFLKAAARQECDVACASAEKSCDHCANIAPMDICEMCHAICQTSAQIDQEIRKQCKHTIFFIKNGVFSPSV